MTQQDVADQLAKDTGHNLPQASISAMERGFDGERRRRFDAHELYLLSRVFDVPIVYFFLPPPKTDRFELADSRRPVVELYRSLLGTDEQLDVVDDRLAEITIEDPETADELLAAIFGPEGAVRNWHAHFRTWRQDRLREVVEEYGDRLDEVAEFLVRFGSKIKALGPAGYLHSSAYRDGDPAIGNVSRTASNDAED